MKWSIIKKLTVVFGLVLAVIVLNAVLSISNMLMLIQSQQGVIESQQVITQLEKTLSTLKSVEIQGRNYLIVRQEEYLQAYKATYKQTDNNIQILKKLIAGNSKQQWVNLLENKITNQFNILQEEPLFKTRGLKAAVEFVTNDIENLISDRLQTEQKLLQQRIYESQGNSRRTIAIFTVMAFVDLLLLALLYYHLITYITRIKLAEQSLLQSENRLRAMIDAEPECIKLIAADGTLLEINASGVVMMEVETADELIGMSVYSGIAPEYREVYRTLHESVCQGKKGTLEFEIVGCKGTRRWMKTHAVPLRNELDGTFLHLAVTRDITKRKYAEEKIREQAALLDIATDAILVRDINSEILFWNKGAERLYGWQVEEALGKNASQFLYKEILPPLEDALAAVVKVGLWQGELTQKRKDGKEIIVESRWTLVRDEFGQPKSILIVNTEITQKKLLEAQLLRSQRLESIGTLAGGIAHDLNNVLSPIMMSVQLLQMKLPDTKSQQILKTLENNVTRGSNLIKQVLSFARGIESKRIIVQVKHLLNEVEQIITETFPKSITCHTDIAEHLGVVCGDTTQLHQVLMNLVVNARDAMPDGGILTILAQNIEIDEHYAQMNIDARIGSYIAITVADTGIGMSKEVQERIFEPFFTTKEIGSGTGLGLSTTIRIIQNHSGFVNLYSEVGKGTTFKVYLPTCIHNESYSPVQEFQPLTGNGEMILVVDDEAAIREITKSSLLAYNYQVLTAGDGVEAVATYTKHQQEISLVLLDMMMPSMDGAIAMRALQNINPNVKIIAISGLPSEQKIRHAQAMGIRAFLSKPCTTIELLQNINTVLSGKLV
jgi:two-component system, cell cycle sensor histidine kinase and response regulator CckA